MYLFYIITTPIHSYHPIVGGSWLEPVYRGGREWGMAVWGRGAGIMDFSEFSVLGRGRRLGRRMPFHPPPPVIQSPIEEGVGGYLTLELLVM